MSPSGRRRLGFCRLPSILLLALLPRSVLAADAIEHPAADQFPPHIAGALREAQSRFTQATSPGGSEYGELGQAYHALDLNIPAAQAYRQATGLAPSDARWPYFLGLLDETQGRFAEAAEWFQLSLELNPDYPPAALRLARMQIAMAKFAPALVLLERIVKAAPQLAAAHAELGLLLQRLGRASDAVRELTAALELQPTASSLHAALGLAWRDTGNSERARHHFSLRGDREVVLDDPLFQSVRARSRSYNYFLTLGVRAAENGDFESADRYLGQAQAIAPDNTNVLITLARVAEARNQIDVGLTFVDRALALEPDNALAAQQRGALLEISGQWEAAMPLYRQALAGDENLSAARLLLANGLMRGGQYAEAIGHLERLQRSDESNLTVTLRLAASQYENGQCRAATATLDDRLRQRADRGMLLALGRLLAACEDAEPVLVRRVSGALRQLSESQPAAELTTTLAMLEMRWGSPATAVALQSQALSLAERNGSSEARLAAMREALARYALGQPPTRPWRTDHPVSLPALLQAGER